MRKTAVLLVIALFLSLCCCSHVAEKQTLQDLVVSCKNISSARCTQATVSVDGKIYFFSNGYDRIPEDFYNSLNQYEIEEVTEKEVSYNQIYIDFYNPYEDGLDLCVDEKDHIIIDNDYDKVYKCEGIYDSLREYFKPIFAESNLCYQVGHTPVTYGYEYVIYDKEYQTIKYDTSSRQPHITRINDDVVCLWIQGGTGILARWSVYYNTATGEISPTYNGQTDSYGTLTCNTGSGIVEVSDIFSGEIVYTIDDFDEPIATFVENISSAYFSEDGSQIIVEYLNTEVETCRQVYELPASVIKK
ncbi:MAG: hypothetical protein IKT55_04640 [Clostridia bacterium]|nr:hypothetical protein [Clostridia bacterium]